MQTGFSKTDHLSTFVNLHILIGIVMIHIWTHSSFWCNWGRWGPFIKYVGLDSEVGSSQSEMGWAYYQPFPCFSKVKYFTEKHTYKVRL